MDLPLTPRHHTDLSLPARGARRHADPPWAGVFAALPVATLVLGADARVTACNAAAVAMLGPAVATGARCCELLGCRVPGGGLADGCVTRLARSRGGLGERRVQLEDGTTAWLAAMPVAAGGDVVVTLRPDAEGAAAAEAPGVLRVLALGRTRLEAGGRAL